MRSPISSAVFMACMVMALLMAFGGLAQIFSSSGSTLFGIVLILATFGISRYARRRRAVYLHRQKMTGLWQWAQGLGPRGKLGRRRPW